MRDEIEEGIRRTLELMSRLGIDGEILRHEEVSGRTSEGAAEALGVPLERVVKTLIFTAGGRFAAVVTLGDRRVDVKALRDLVGLKKPRLATPEEVERLLGFSPGGIPPFAPAGLMPCLVEQAALELDWVVGAAGSEFAGVRFDPKGLLSLGFKPAKVSRSCEKRRYEPSEPSEGYDLGERPDEA
ncbi:MAG: YbaK/EbsC family protein [Candidatus Korarchaeota archaeon]|nr:YbaK/EbsC family protein [Candidatus Korarchaeota archaeon]